MTDAPTLTEARALRLLLLLLAMSTLARLGLAALLDLGVDEAYARTIAVEAALSYFDHPPLAFWIVHAVMSMAGPAAPDWLLRLPFVLLFTGTTALVYRLARDGAGPAAGLWAALALTLSPFFLVSGGGWLVPDGPLLFFLAAAALVLSRILFGAVDERTARWLWLAAGLLLGLAMLSKYHAVLTAAGAFVFLAASPRHRRWLATPWPYAAGVVALVVFAPVLVWNAGNGWVSLLFQGARAAARGDGLARGLQTLGGAIAYLLPWTFAALAWSLARALFPPRDGTQDAAGRERGRFFATLALPPIVVFTAVPFLGGQGLPHWSMPGWLFAYPLLGANLARWTAAGSPWPRRLAGTSAGLIALAVLAVAALPALRDRLPAPAAAGIDKYLEEASAWHGLAGALAARGDLPADGFAVALNWIDGARLAEALATAPATAQRLPVLVFSEDPRGHAFLHDPAAEIGRDAVIVGRGRRFDEALARAAPLFARIERKAALDLPVAGTAAIRLEVALGRDLRKPYRLPYPVR